MIEAEVRKANNIPVITRRFRDVARLAIDRLEHEQASGNGKVIYRDYLRAIKDVCVPHWATRKELRDCRCYLNQLASSISAAMH